MSGKSYTRATAIFLPFCSSNPKNLRNHEGHSTGCCNGASKSAVYYLTSTYIPSLPPGKEVGALIPIFYGCCPDLGLSERLPQMLHSRLHVVVFGHLPMCQL